VAACFAAPRVPDAVSWGLSAVLLPLIALALWVTAPLNRARSLLARKDYEGAVTALAAFEAALATSWKRALASRAVGFYSSNPRAVARNTLGGVRLEQGKLDEAETHFASALELDPLYGVPWGNRAVLAAMRGDAAAAEAARLEAAERGFAPKLLAQVITEKLKRSPLPPRQGEP
jgi:tetratricopeptide (TPR) repeat protein